MSPEDPPAGPPPNPVYAVHIGRQPMFDSGRSVIGYELLFRSEHHAPGADQDGSFATSQVIVSAFTDFGIDELVGDKLAFINVTRDFLVGELTLPFPPGQAVLEVLESIVVDDAVVEGAARLAEQGYPIALDDFVWELGHERLLSVATYVKLDFLGTPPEQLTAIARAVRERPAIQLIAEKVETEEQIALGHRLGCSIFQGYALGRPKVVSGVTLTPARLPRVKLLAELNGPAVDIERVVGLVTADPALSFRLLRATNAASTGLVRKVASVREAVVLLGLSRVRQWVTLMLVTDLGSGREDQISSAIVRARTCQSLAERMGVPGDTAFTVGLLAGVADMLGIPVADLAGGLPLTPEVIEALVRHSGRLGKVLDLVQAYEANEPDRWAPAQPGPGSMAQGYLDAVGWTQRTMTTLTGATRSE